jgi:Ni,Fe-hydrogenase III small subunit
MVIYRGPEPSPGIDGHTYGETGEPDDSPVQRWADAHWWRIRVDKHPKIRLLIVVVSGELRRIWPVELTSNWEQEPGGKIALPLGARPLTSDEVHERYPGLGITIGDHRPSRQGLMREYVPVDGH